MECECAALRGDLPAARVAQALRTRRPEPRRPRHFAAALRADVHWRWAGHDTHYRNAPSTST